MSRENPLRQLVDKVASGIGVTIDKSSYERLDRMAAWDLSRIK
jgi:hypothetical protein